MKAYTTEGDTITLIDGVTLGASIKCLFIIVTPEEHSDTTQDLEVTFNYEQPIDGLSSETYNLTYLQTIDGEHYFNCIWYPFISIGSAGGGTEFNTATLDLPSFQAPNPSSVTSTNNPTYAIGAIDRATSVRFVVRYSDEIETYPGSHLAQWVGEPIYDATVPASGQGTTFTVDGQTTILYSHPARLIGEDRTLPDGFYTVSVKATNDQGEYSDWDSHRFQVKTSQQAPNSWVKMPSKIRVSTNGPAPEWSWNLYGATRSNVTILKTNDPTNESSWAVHHTETIESSISPQSYTLPLNQGGHYKFKVSLQDVVGNTSTEFEYYTSVEVDSTPPTVSDVTCTLAIDNPFEYVVNWTSSEDTEETQISIDYADIPGSSWGTIKVPRGINTRRISNLPWETNLIARVWVRDDLVNWSAASVDCPFRTIAEPVLPPSPPVPGVTFLAPPYMFSWGPVADDWIQIEYQFNWNADVPGESVLSPVRFPEETGRDEALGGTAMGDIDSQIQASYVVDGVNDFRIRAKNSAGWGEWFETEITVDVLPGQVQNMAMVGTDNPVTFTWDPNIDGLATAYEVTVVFHDNTTKDAVTVTQTSYTPDYNIPYGQVTLIVTSVKPSGLKGAATSKIFTLSDPNNTFDFEALDFVARYEPANIQQTANVVTQWTDSSGNNYHALPRFPGSTRSAQTGAYDENTTGVNFGSVHRCLSLQNTDVVWPDRWCLMQVMLVHSHFPADYTTETNYGVMGGYRPSSAESPLNFAGVVQSQYYSNSSIRFAIMNWNPSTSSTIYLPDTINISRFYIANGTRALFVCIGSKNAGEKMHFRIYNDNNSYGGSRTITEPTAVALANGLTIGTDPSGNYCVNATVAETALFPLDAAVDELNGGTGSEIVDQAALALANKYNIQMTLSNPYAGE